MAVGLKAKNESGAAMDVTLDSKAAKITFAAGEEKELTAEYLVSKSFEKLLGDGTLSLSTIPATTADQYKLARLLLPDLIGRLGGHHGVLLSQLLSQKAALAKRRDAYNSNFTPTQALVASAKSVAAPCSKLNDGAKFYFSTKPEDDAVTKAKTDIATLEAEDLTVSGRTLAAWYADREAKQAVLDKAVKAQDAMKADIKKMQDVLANLDKAATEFNKADPTKDVGKKIDPW